MKRPNISYNPTLISSNEAKSMRGIAIFFIVAHNLLHLIIPTQECEFWHSIWLAKEFVECVAEHPAYAFADIISFLGWYGVAVFVFLSGYNLTLKYERDSSEHIGIISFTAKHWYKTFKLMFIPMTIYIILFLSLEKESVGQDTIFQFIKQYTLLGNILFPLEINPGVYWFFGLIFQLYILYRLLIYRRSTIWLIILTIIGYISVVKINQGEDTLKLMHNSIGWIIPFSVGAIFARHDFTNLFKSRHFMIATVILSGFILAYMSYNLYTWILSPIVAIITSISLSKLWCKGMWLGAISASIFVIHPIVQCISMQESVLQLFGVNKQDPYTLNVVALLVAYILVSILLAALYHRYIRAKC